MVWLATDKQQLNYASLKAGQHRLSETLDKIDLPHEKTFCGREKAKEN
jgi:hypothetical protein